MTVVDAGRHLVGATDDPHRFDRVVEGQHGDAVRGSRRHPAAGLYRPAVAAGGFSAVERLVVGMEDGQAEKHYVMRFLPGRADREFC